MRFAFEFPFALPSGVSVEDVLSRSVPSSGTVNSVRLAVNLAALGADCTIFDTSNGAPSAAEVAGVKIVKAAPHAAGDTILVLPPQSSMTTLRAIRRNAGKHGPI